MTKRAGHLLSEACALVMLSIYKKNYESNRIHMNFPPKMAYYIVLYTLLKKIWMNYSLISFNLDSSGMTLGLYGQFASGCGIC